MLTEKLVLPEKKEKLIASATSLVLGKGFASSSIDDICALAKVTKGSFYHYFKSKDEIGIAVLKAWGAYGLGLYADGTSAKTNDPFEQINLMIDVMIGFSLQPKPCVCAVGMISQEVSLHNEVLRIECDHQLTAWTNMVELILSNARRTTKTTQDYDPLKLAWFLNSIWQGSMLVAKAHNDPSLIQNNLEQARSYINSHFERTEEKD